MPPRRREILRAVEQAQPTTKVRRMSAAAKRLPERGAASRPCPGRTCTHSGALSESTPGLDLLSSLAKL